ncbi:BCCT family transporter [Rothia sp. ZJ932]|uniref:BCCT family transporter n=1 Tax=Rothia sp. ZJ932 TaxID=2810516 RepID=UPI0019687F08|nr:BCCT family transporter [Rothia sp. ZJ932]QRZ60830.1 BCCT family transporter [Rothia sp. ZJ932]
MIHKIHDRLGLRTSPAIFFLSAGFVLIFTLAMAAFPTEVGDSFGIMSSFIIEYLGWFYVLGVAIFAIFLVYMAVSRFGRIKLGDDDADPEYSGLAWFGMMFAAGVGAVLLFWGAAEPISHYANPPYEGVEPLSNEAILDSLAISNLHIGLGVWIILVVPGLAFGYFTYKRKLPPRVSSVFQPLLGDGIHGPIGKAIDSIAIISTVFGIAVSVGMGALQINSGMNIMYGVPVEGWVQAIIIAVITATGVASVVAGMDKGVKMISYVNILLAIALMLFILMAGASRYIITGTIESAGYFFQKLPVMLFFNDALNDTGWIGSWTVFYWAWTITWAPFVGLFIAKISQGRTIRQFIVAAISGPSLFTMLWLGVFGFSAFNIERNENGTLIQRVVEEGDIPAALFEFLGHFPAYQIVAVVTLIVITLFFVTSIDSAALVMDSMSNGHEDEAPRRQRVFWALAIGMVCAIILVSAGDNGLKALQNVIIVIGLPVLALGYLQMWMIVRGVREDAGELPPMRTRQWKRVLPIEEYHRRAQEDISSVEDVVMRPEYEVGTEPEFESLVPNTGQIRIVTADEIAQDAQEKTIAGAPAGKFATHEFISTDSMDAVQIDPNTGKPTGSRRGA